jgi:hypothetical protein
LKHQVNTAGEFAVDYCYRYNENKGLEDLNGVIDGFADKVNDRISQLDQTVRDLLQFVSILAVLSNNSPELILYRNLPGSRSMRPTNQRALQQA